MKTPFVVTRMTLLGVILSIQLACQRVERRPPDLLSEAAMASILADIHVAEAHVAQLRLQSLDSSVVVYEVLQHKIWEKYQVDTAQYRKSYSFYTQNPDYMVRIYELVEKKMERRAQKNDISL